nr:ladybird [Hymenolepis microstoma]
MFAFGQDFSDFLLKNGPPFNNNLLQNILLRAQKRHFEEMNSPQNPPILPQFPQARNKTEVPQDSCFPDNIIWSPKPLHLPTQPVANPSTSNSSSRLPSPSASLQKKQFPKGVKSRTETDGVLSQNEFTTPALNSLIEMTLSNSYQLGNSSETCKSKSGQKHATGMSGSDDLNSRNGGMSNRAPKRRKTRTTFTSFQLAELEVYFNKQKYLTPTDRDQIASELGLSSTQVITWFQNRRAKKKRECTELERDLMAGKTKFENLQQQTQSNLSNHQITSKLPPISPCSSATSINEAPFTSVFMRSKSDSCASSQLTSESSSHDPKPIWRPVCLEDIGRE